MAEPFSTNISEHEVQNSSELSSTNRGKRNTPQPAKLDLIIGKWQAALGTGTATGKICNNSDTLISLSSCCISAFIFLLMPWNSWHFFLIIFFPFFFRLEIGMVSFFLSWIKYDVLSMLSWAQGLGWGGIFLSLAGGGWNTEQWEPSKGTRGPGVSLSPQAGVDGGIGGDSEDVRAPHLSPGSWETGSIPAVPAWEFLEVPHLNVPTWITTLLL